MNVDHQPPADFHAKELLDRFRQDFDALRREIGKVIVGQDKIVEGVLTALIAGGHVLLEGVPGLGKTLWCERSPTLCMRGLRAFSSRPT